MRTHQHTGRAANPFERVGQKAFAMRTNSVLQCAPVNLDGIRGASRQSAGEDHRAHHQMIGERDVRHWGGTNRSDVGVEVMAERHLVDVREGHCIKALIAIRDVDGKQSANVGHVDGHTLRRQCRPVLAEQVHLMSQTSQRPRQVGVVDVATGAAQQVAVEYEDPHRVAAIPRVTIGQMRVTSAKGKGRK